MASPNPNVETRRALFASVFERLLAPLPDEEPAPTEATDEATDGDSRADEAA